jgi:hypothetical protein
VVQRSQRAMETLARTVPAAQGAAAASGAIRGTALADLYTDSDSDTDDQLRPGY